jgi:hypothetical protein
MTTKDLSYLLDHIPSGGLKNITVKWVVIEEDNYFDGELWKMKTAYPVLEATYDR